MLAAASATGSLDEIRVATMSGIAVTSPDVFLEIDALTATWHNPFPDSLGRKSIPSC